MYPIPVPHISVYGFCCSLEPVVQIVVNLFGFIQVKEFQGQQFLLTSQ